MILLQNLIFSFAKIPKRIRRIRKKWRQLYLDGIDLLSYRLQKTSLKRGKSYIESREWLKNKRATINPKNNDDNCFQYAITVALNHQNIQNNPERVSNIEPNQYNWKGIDLPSHQRDWKKFEHNNKTSTLNILYLPSNTKQIRLAYKSKYNCQHENQVILLMITDGEKVALSCFKK